MVNNKISKLLVSFFLLVVGIIMYPLKTDAFDPPKVTTVMIPEYQQTMKPPIEHSLHPIPLHLAEINNFLMDNKITSLDIMKYIYPSYTTDQLKSTSAGLDESLSYFDSKNIRYTKSNGLPQQTIILNELKEGRPILVYLQANNSYWLEPESAVIITGIQILEFSSGVTNTLYTCRSLNHNDTAIFSGMENSIDLLTLEKSRDQTINTTYSLKKTVYGFKK